MFTRLMTNIVAKRSTPLTTWSLNTTSPALTPPIFPRTTLLHSSQRYFAIQRGRIAPVSSVKPTSVRSTLTPHRNTTPQHSQSHAPTTQQQHPHMPDQQQQQLPPQSLGSTIGYGLLDGLTFGVGSSLAHRAADSLFGPRTVQVEHTGLGAAGAAGDMGDAPQQDYTQDGGQNWAPDNTQYAQQDWQQPADPYGQPEPMFGGGSWDDQNEAAEEAAGGSVFGALGSFFKDE